jgi:uncharacterized protein (DUF433 family)
MKASTKATPSRCTPNASRAGWRKFSYLCYDYRDIITNEPGKRSGQPCIRGLRLNDFPDLTREDIRACLAFAADRELCS